MKSPRITPLAALPFPGLSQRSCIIVARQNSFCPTVTSGDAPTDIRTLTRLWRCCLSSPSHSAMVIEIQMCTRPESILEKNLLSRSQRQSRSVGAAKRPSKNPKSSDQCFTCNSKEARCSILFPTSPHPTHEKEWSMHIPVPPKYTSDRGSEPTHITRQVDPNGLVSSGSCRRVLPKAQKSAVVWGRVAKRSE
jgi:hypothetical protein